ncbi:hypothetical protein [Paenibacillus endoradicis]|uniref:hypothetical protein n=1 Tax=Paenibacillus endoradicis TaxID=2972487 RepID=UPI00215999CB|nr:hypothetical protein [Paenibacillus endoradicis]MCR8659877.1 hypothetical protein [Paenibacillus endoradicis]
MKLLSYKWKMVLVVLIMILSALLFVACGVQSKELDKEQTVDQSKGQSAVSSNDEDGVQLGKDESVLEIDETTEDLESLFTNPVAEISGGNIYMDITETGEYMLQINDQSYTYNWTGMTPRGILPSMALEDFDRDGQDELAVILYVGSGTGISISELHMLEINQVGDVQQVYEYLYQPDQYISELQEKASIRLFEQASLLKGELAFGENSFEVDLQDLQAPDYGTINDTLIWGNITEFSVEDQQLIGTFGVAVGAEKIVSPIYIGKLNTVISYKDGEFTMSQYEFEEYENK